MRVLSGDGRRAHREARILETCPQMSCQPILFNSVVAPDTSSLPTSVGSVPAGAGRMIVRLSWPLSMALDIAAWTCAVAAAVYLWFEFKLGQANLVALAKFVPLSGLVQIALGLAIGPYRRRWRHGSSEVAKALVSTVVPLVASGPRRSPLALGTATLSALIAVPRHVADRSRLAGRQVVDIAAPAVVAYLTSLRWVPRPGVAEGWLS